MRSAFPKQEWTDFALKCVRETSLPELRPVDLEQFFPFGVASPENYVHLLAAMCKFESDFNPNTTYAESGNLEGVISVGLLQLSKDSVAGYGFKVSSEELKDPMLNIKIAVAILERWVKQDNCIGDDSSPWRGGARYWSVLRAIKNKDGSIKLTKTENLCKSYCAQFNGSSSTKPEDVPFPLTRTLQMGMTGVDVATLQNRLIQTGYLQALIAGERQNDSFFGKNTKAAVISWQKDHNLVVDAKVGTLTWASLWDAHTSPPDEPEGPVNPEDPPAEIKTPKKPRTNAEAAAIFGNSQSAVESQLAFCEVPSELKCFGLKNGKRGFTTHKLMVPVFGAVFKEIVKQGLASKIYSYDGCYNWRVISGSSNRSLHSYAIAIDLNYEGNELGDSTPAMDKQVVAIFKKFGFFWGGDYVGRKDGMHFEWYDRS